MTWALEEMVAVKRPIISMTYSIKMGLCIKLCNAVYCEK
jgi:hypothetical protein